MQNLFNNDGDFSISPEWDELLKLYYPRLILTLQHVDKRRKQTTVYPSKELVFNAFSVKPNEVNIVIIGQDPYPNENALGYAFGCANTISDSLLQIVSAIRDSYPNGQYGLFSHYPDLGKRDRTLNYWRKQGILLLNTVLTVDEDVSGSHRNEYAWECFIEYVVETLAAYNKNIIWMLWGNNAKELKSNILKENKDAHILTASHPVSASYTNENWKTDNFKRANIILSLLKKKEIIWL